MNNLSILAVNDNFDQLELLAFMLGESGYRVLTADNAVEALEIARRESPDLIISDVLMPGLDGIEFCRRIRADRKLRSTPFLLISALRNDTESVVGGLAAGADDYIEAPYEPLRLVAKVTQLIERQRAANALREGEERYRNFIEQSTEGIWRVEFKVPIPIDISIDEAVELAGRHSFYAECNDRMAQMYGFAAASDLTGKYCHEMLNFSESDNREFVRTFFENGYRINDGESHETDADGRDKYFINNFVGTVENGNLVSIWGTQRDVTESKLAEQISQASRARLEKQNAVLNELTKRRKLFYVPVQEAVREITEITARVLETQRVGVWLYDVGKTKIKALDVFDSSLDSHSEGVELRQADYPVYFEALAKDEAIVCDDMRTDSRTQELMKSYLKPFDISSMLDVPIRFGGQVVGVLCHEHVGAVRAWKVDERSFVASMASLVALLLEANERRQAENALRESQEYLEIAQQAAQIGSFNFNFETRRLTCSTSMECLYGASPGGLNGNLGRWFKHIHPEDLPAVKRQLKQITSDIEYKSEFRILTADGGVRWILSIGKTFFDDAGNPVRLTGVNIDTTERKQAELTLSFQKTLLEAQSEASIDGILVVSPTREVLSYNRRFVDMWEMPEEVLATRSGAAFLKPLTEKLVEPQEFLETVAYFYGHPSIGNQIEISLNDGRVFERHSAPVMKSDKTHFGRIWSFRDITKRKLIEEKLRQAEARYRSLVESSPAIVYLAEPVHPYSSIYVSPNVKLFGYAAEEWFARDDMWISLIHPEDRRRVLSATEAAMNQNLETETEYRIVGRGGEIFWVHDKGCFVSDLQGSKIGWQGVILDVTETKRLEEQLRQSQKLESVGKLAGGIAHDFNNMLTAINGFSELTLRALSASSPLRGNIEEIKKAGERSALLTHQLLAFSRKQVLKPKILNLNEVIVDISQMLNRLIGEHIALELIADSKLGTVEVDPGQLTQVIVNLAVNARDAMPHGGQLTIETSNVYVDEEYAENHFPTAVGAYVLVTVSDTGAGINENTKQQIFEPFFTTKELGRGTGLGLATVYGIVKQSGGYIWVDSEVGKGTSFKIYLPRVKESDDPTAENRTSKPILAGTETILLVEDEDMVRKMSRQMLETAGYQVIEAVNGIQALSICELQFGTIDLLLTDVVMPQMSGRKLAEKIAEIYPHIRLLYMSGYTDDQVLRRELMKEGKNFIQKPFTFEALTDKIRKLLD